MNSARFAKVAKVLALSVALGTGLAVSLLSTPSDVVYAQDALPQATSDTLHGAVADFNKGKYKDAADKFREVMVGMPTDADEASNYLVKVREFIPNDTQRDLLTMTGSSALKGEMAMAFTTLKSVGVWLAEGRLPKGSADGVIFGRHYDDKAMPGIIKEYMGEADPLLRLQRSRVIAQSYGEFAVMTLFNEYLAKVKPGEKNREAVARVQSLLIEIGSQAVMPLVQAMNFRDENRDEALTPVVRVLGEIRSNVALPALKEELESNDNSDAFRTACQVAINKILEHHNASGDVRADRVTADAQTLWYLQANGWYLNDAVGGYGPTYNTLVGTNFAGHLPSVTDSYGLKYAVWHWDTDKGGIDKQIVPSWLYANSLAEYSAEKAADLAQRRSASRGFGDNPEADPFVLNAMSLQARIAIHQYTSADARLARVAKDADRAGIEAENELIDTVLRSNKLLRTGHLQGLAAAMGPSVLMNALRQANEQGYPEVAVELCNALMEVNRYGSIFDEYLAPATSEASVITEEEAREIEEERAANAEEADTDDEAGEEADLDDEAEMMAMEDDAEAERQRRFLAPLIAASMRNSEQVRFAASRALVGIAPNLEYAGMDQVVSYFSAALQQTSLKNVIVISTDEMVRTQVRAIVNQKLTYAITTYDNVEAGLRQLTQSPIYDAIIISAEDAAQTVNVFSPDARSSGLGDPGNTEVDTAYRVLLTDVGVRNIPRIFIGDASALSGVSSQSLTIIESVTDGQEALVAALQTAVGEDAGQDASNAYIIKSCEVIRSFDPNQSDLDMGRIINSVAASLGAPYADSDGGSQTSGRAGRSTAARIALADTLAHLAAYDNFASSDKDAVIGGLVNILGTAPPAPNADGTMANEDGKDTAAVRASVCNALGEIMRNHQSEPEFAAYKVKVMNALFKCQRLSGDDADTRAARAAAGHNLGKLKLTLAEKQAIFKSSRFANFKADNGSGK